MAASCMFLVIVAAALVLISPTHGSRAYLSSHATKQVATTEAPVTTTVDMTYHMGPVLTSDIAVYIIWYGAWNQSQQAIIKDFLTSISSSVAGPSVESWWSTLQLYTDESGGNVSKTVRIAGEARDEYSLGKQLTRMTVQQVIKKALQGGGGSLPADPKGGVYLVLTADDVLQQDFCRAACGFHYFTYPSIVGYALPYAWIGNSGKQCPGTCAFPFALPSFFNFNATSLGLPFKPPNADIGVDGMVSVIAHEMAEMASDPFINAWFAGPDPAAPAEIADLCEGIYGSGGGGGFPGLVSVDHSSGASYNLNGVAGRRFLVQWLWNPLLNACSGPNA